jgi:choloylglycine hydrolase
LREKKNLPAQIFRKWRQPSLATLRFNPRRSAAHLPFHCVHQRSDENLAAVGGRMFGRTAMQKRLLETISLFVLLLTSRTTSTALPLPAHADVHALLSAASQACTSFCLDNDDHCVFGANQDNSIDAGLVFVTKRNVQKTGWDPSATGKYARWISKYGSVTIVHAGYQMAWAGMNEAGLMLSTMALAQTRNPARDARPPLASPFWMQYQLDNHSTVAEVIASDAYLRIADTVDHYLVCDRKGDCAVIEFLDGKMVYHTRESLPVKALANSPYQASLQAWRDGVPKDNSLQRFAQAAERSRDFTPSSATAAVDYAFGTLAQVALDVNAWRIVFDPVNRQVHFRTNRNPQRRYVDFGKLDFSCRTPVTMLDIHANGAGDVSGNFAPYSHEISLAHTIGFFEKYERLNYPLFLIEALLRGLESFPCQEGDTSARVGSMEDYSPLLPPTAIWLGLAVFYRAWQIWLLLILLSLAFVIWRMVRGEPTTWGRWLIWMLVVALLGPIGLLIYLFGHGKRDRTTMRIG